MTIDRHGWGQSYLLLYLAGGNKIVSPVWLPKITNPGGMKTRTQMMPLTTISRK